MRLLSSPVFDGRLPPDPTVDVAELYAYTIDQHRAGLVAAVRALAALPALVHCTAGKDRTGLVVALALAVAGVPRDTVVEDYALSSRYLGGDFVAQVRRQLASWNSDAAEAALALDLAVDSPPEAMRQALDHLDREYGGAEGYLTGGGVTPEELAGLRHELGKV